ncbi:MAG: protein kinase [Xanthobacteraceae bacterium]|nr:protein kinase [Xanthobacteraceae bacterium]
MAIQNDPNALKTGSKIAGYEILRVIGSGGFGITYEAASPITGKHVAIKEFFPRGIASREESTRIIFAARDADLAAWALKRFESSTTDQCRLRHPNIVDVIHYVKDNDTGYMIMEYVEGETLEDWLKQRETPPRPDELRPLLDPVFSALEYLHAQKLIHRDIAPDNIMVRPNGTPVIIDFGAIKLIEQQTQARSKTNRSFTVSKQFYSPPEQVQEGADQLDMRADVYAMAATIYRALAGRPPASAEERTQQIAFGNGDPLKPLATLAPSLPASFASAIDRALAFNARNRTPSIDALREEIGWGDAGATAATAAVSAAPASKPEPKFSTTPSSAPSPARVAASKKPSWRWVAPVVVTATLAGAIILIGGSWLNLFGTRGPALIVQQPPPVLTRQPQAETPPAPQAVTPPPAQMPQLATKETPPAPSPAAQPETKADPQADARKDFEFAQKVDSIDAYEQFLKRYPEGFYAQLARAQVQRLTAVRTRELTVKLNAELRRAGCGVISSNEIWGDESKKALTAFNQHAATRLDISMPTDAALDAVKARTDRVCPLVCPTGQSAQGETCVAICAPGTVLAPNGTCVRPVAPQQPVVRNQAPQRKALKCRWGDFNKGEQPHRQVCE